MIGIDANVAVRHLVADDDEEQHAAVESLLAGVTAENPAWVSLVVVVETA
ncbi:MAG: hypothetical protein LBH76_02800 [Propionibacteriaceae bacterium]|nr:hypothetical protein [Propionibacteriaceae bacterium]